jgi:hypothetical protein
MYARVLRNASHIRRFLITPRTPSGWDILEERDDAVVRSVHYDDWHRVERVRRAFALQAELLRAEGWTEVLASS